MYTFLVNMGNEMKLLQICLCAANVSEVTYLPPSECVCRLSVAPICLCCNSIYDWILVAGHSWKRVLDPNKVGTCSKIFFILGNLFATSTTSTFARGHVNCQPRL